MEIDHTFNFPLTIEGKVVKCTLVAREKLYEVLFDDEPVTELNHTVNGWTDEKPGILTDDALRTITQWIEENWV